MEDKIENKDENKLFNNVNTVNTSINVNNPVLLTSEQKSQLENLANLSDAEVRKQAESDSDCPSLDDKF